MASWVSQSHSSTNTVQTNSQSSVLIGTSKIIQDTDIDLQSTERKLMQESLLGTRCNGIMGVPITFLDKWCPDQFEIIGMCENEDLYGLKTKKYSTQQCKEAYLEKFGKKGTYDLNASGVIVKEGRKEKVYQRVLIRRKNENRAT